MWGAREAAGAVIKSVLDIWLLAQLFIFAPTDARGTPHARAHGAPPPSDRPPSPARQRAAEAPSPGARGAAAAAAGRRLRARHCCPAPPASPDSEMAAGPPPPPWRQMLGIVAGSQASAAAYRRVEAISDRCLQHCLHHTAARGAAVWSEAFALPALAKLIRDEPSTAARADPGHCAIGVLNEMLRAVFDGSPAAAAAFAAGAEQAGLPAALYDALTADAEADTPARAARASYEGSDGCIHLVSALTRPNPEFDPRAPADVVLRFCAAALERLARVKARRARAL